MKSLYGTSRRATLGCRYGRELILAADKAPTQDSTCSRNLITVPDFTGMTRKEVLSYANGGAGVTVRTVTARPCRIDPISSGDTTTRGRSSSAAAGGSSAARSSGARRHAMAALAAPDEPLVHAARAEIYATRRDSERSFMASGIYRSAALDSEERAR